MVDKLLTKDYRVRPDIEQILRLDSMTEKMRLYGYQVTPIEQLKINRHVRPIRSQEPSSAAA